MATPSSPPHRRLAISNIAWPAEHDGDAVRLAAELGFDGIEIAPAKVFGDVFAASLSDVRAYRKALTAQGLSVPALQGILFGARDAHLFTSDDTRTRMAAHLHRIAEIAAELGAAVCVFGAPALRNPGELPPGEAFAIATDFFRAVAREYSRLGVRLCFEANPEFYGCRFATHTNDAARLVAAVAEPGMALQLDTGTIFINHEAPETIVETAEVIGHFHISEPDLVAIGSGGVDHAPLGASLARSAYSGWISIEMRGGEGWADAMRAAHDLAMDVYVRPEA